MRLGQGGHKAWEDQKNEIDMVHLQKRIKEDKDSVDEEAISEQVGRYDRHVENLIETRQIAEALEFCREQLLNLELTIDRREIYMRYMRVIEEEFGDGQGQQSDVE